MRVHSALRSQPTENKRCPLSRFAAAILDTGSACPKPDTGRAGGSDTIDSHGSPHRHVVRCSCGKLRAKEPRKPARSPATEHHSLTHFGERADISPDNRRVAFMAKSFGDAFVIDLDTRIIRCLTCGVPGTAFLRVMHLSTGDYILIGPERFKRFGRAGARTTSSGCCPQDRGSRSRCVWARR